MYGNLFTDKNVVACRNVLFFVLILSVPTAHFYLDIKDIGNDNI